MGRGLWTQARGEEGLRHPRSSAAWPLALLLSPAPRLSSFSSQAILSLARATAAVLGVWLLLEVRRGGGSWRKMTAPNQNLLWEAGSLHSGLSSSAPSHHPWSSWGPAPPKSWLKVLQASRLAKEFFFSPWRYEGLASLLTRPCHWIAGCLTRALRDPSLP